MQILLEKIKDAFQGIQNIETQIINPASEGTGAIPTLMVKLDAAALGQSTRNIIMKLGNGNPRLCFNEKQLQDNILLISSLNLNEPLTGIISNRLREVLTRL